MGRLALVLTLAMLCAPLPVGAQAPSKVYRVGVLSPGSPPLGPLEAFRRGLHDLGYVEGRNVAIEWRFAEGENERLPALADELLRLKVQVIFAVNTPAAQAAKNATRETPIVIARLADPVRSGLVPSIARPGGNITGLSSIPEEMAAKRLELLKEILPGASRVAALWNAGNPGHPHVVRGMELASPPLGLQLQSLPVRDSKELVGAFQAASRWHAEALVVIDDVLITTYRTQIIGLAAKHSLPVIANFQEFAQAGALVTYGHSVTDEYRRAASYVDKIFKGAKPADLPIEQPTTFHLVVNLKAAKALSLTIPRSVLLRADEVIQ